jgi:sugar-specific transcriptional regulator TrmB
MTEEQLQQLGLSPSQAKAYIQLVLVGRLSPSELMQKTGESRTNAYMVLDRLVELNMAYKDEVSKKLVYRAKSPVGLQKLAERQRLRAAESERKIRDAMPDLVTFYQSHRMQPGIRFIQGKDGLKEVYKDHLRVGGNVQVFRTMADDDYYGQDLMDYMQERARRGIATEMISPYQKGFAVSLEREPELKREVTWVPPDAYVSPVEISIYNGRVAITSFGEEAVATIIESPQIASAMREIFALAKAGADDAEAA